MRGTSLPIRLRGSHHHLRGRQQGRPASDRNRYRVRTCWVVSGNSGAPAQAFAWPATRAVGLGASSGHAGPSGAREWQGKRRHTCGNTFRPRGQAAVWLCSSGCWDWQIRRVPPRRSETPPTAVPVRDGRGEGVWNRWAASRRFTSHAQQRVPRLRLGVGSGGGSGTGCGALGGAGGSGCSLEYSGQPNTVSGTGPRR